MFISCKYIECSKKVSFANRKNFEENKNSLVEYIKENRNNNSKDLEEKWEVLWFSTVRNCYTQLKKKSDKSKELSFLINYLSEVFDLENRMITYYLFYQSLKHL